MHFLQTHYSSLCDTIHRLRFPALRQLACATACTLLLGGCSSSSLSVQPGEGTGTAVAQPVPMAAAAKSETLQTTAVPEQSQAASVPQTGTMPLSRGDIPGAGNPAGIQLYAQTDDGIFLLVADHAAPSKRGWAGFGGGYDEGETIAQTAARETEEETRGYFKREDLLAAISGQEPVFDGKFAFYFVKVDMVPAEEINAHTIDGQTIAFAERGPYAWVPYSQIERYLDVRTPPADRGCVIDALYLPAKNANTDWFWPVWLNNFRAALLENALPF